MKERDHPESQKTDSASAPSAKPWTPNPLRNPVCRQILESKSAPDLDFSLCQIVTKMS